MIRHQNGQYQAKNLLRMRQRLMWGQPPPAVRRAKLDRILANTIKIAWARNPEARNLGRNQRSAAKTRSN
jgi:hypothetical protein